MSGINQTLAEVLGTVQRPGDFYVSGRQEIFAPSISVDGVGTVALPLLPQQAAELAAVAERAPYGRGPDTLVDTEVRRTWQIGAEQVHISGRHWAANLQAIVSRCAEGLGVEGPVSAELYKMLVYDEGSFFLGHRDTEKLPGMFATLVVVLPSAYAGGELLIRHQGREVCLVLSSEDAAEVAFAAFYADCWHEVRPITAGCRLALIYNLVRPGRGKRLQPPAYDAEVNQVAALLAQWRCELAAGSAQVPEKLIYPLEHVYTSAEIAFETLKNADAAVGALLVKAARKAQCDLSLALVNIDETGSAEEVYYRRSRHHYRDSDSEEFEVGEVFERRLVLTGLRAADDARAVLERLLFTEDELCPPDVFADAEPDEVQFFEATGNAGATFERSYRRAALVLWPSERRLDLIVAAGRDVSLPWLADLARRWQQGGPEEQAVADLWRQAHELASRIVRSWPERQPWERASESAVRFLEAVRVLEDREALLAFIDKVTVGADYQQGDNAGLVSALALLPPLEAAETVHRIITANAARDPAACAELLRRMSEALGAAHGAAPTAALEQAAADLIAALPGQPAAVARGASGQVRPMSALVVDLLQASFALQADGVGHRLVADVLAHPDVFPADEILVPAALALLTGTEAQRSWPPIRALRGACRNHLARRIAEPLQPPPDFSRPSHVRCRCPHCLQLAHFLADPKRKQWVLKAAEAQRSHVEDSIRRDACDVNTETLRHTRPYELRCTKNQASYQRRVEQRERDLQNEAQLLE